MSKYSEILKQDVAPKSALNALARKVAKQGVLVGDLHEDKVRAREAAAARTPGATFVTRDELLEFAETGNIPDAWVDAPDDAPADPGTDGA